MDKFAQVGRKIFQILRSKQSTFPWIFSPFLFHLIHGIWALKLNFLFSALFSVYHWKNQEAQKKRKKENMIRKPIYRLSDGANLLSIRTLPHKLTCSDWCTS
eukprot:TRINITY_DN26504_c0_g4_i2.p1 TRINITY_DN26504_c0_g4~~TRINITY_DN26504_c0_g4_i2.p1  ORF type:complete len:102 (-),score=13.60 TRINITY_DN26504_c0_g4_i2:2134-2439(-)